MNYFEHFTKFTKEKAKVEKTKQYFNYSELGNIMLTSMFEYNNMYSTFYENVQELYLSRWGLVMTFEHEGDLLTIPCSPVGLPGDNGEYEEFIGHTQNGKTFRKKNHEECVVCYNNILGAPDRMIDYFSNILAELDTSIKLAIVNSRNVPLPIARDLKTKTSIENALKSIRDGEQACILDTNVLAEIENSLGQLQVMNISDVDSADKIQYLSKLHDDLLRRVSTLYGHDFNGSPKSAQQSIKEITGSESFSWILPIAKLKQREAWLEELKEKFPSYIGSDAEVSFSPTWQIQYDAFIAQSEPDSEPDSEP